VIQEKSLNIKIEIIDGKKEAAIIASLIYHLLKLIKLIFFVDVGGWQL
jgi:exopolyphosphatase/guanosine-5'-triphosphate,3'-diphosphate pyrophosphatase